MIRPPPTSGSCVQCSAGTAPAFTVIMIAFGSACRQQFLHFQHMGSKSPIESHHQATSRFARASS